MRLDTKIAVVTGAASGIGRDQGRLDRLHQIPGPRDGATPHQRQLRVPRADGHAVVRVTAGKVRDGLIRAIPFVLFFASDYSNYIIGQVLTVSSGLTMAG